MRPSDQKKRNELVRSEITEIAEQNGMKWTFIANKLNMERSNFSNWRRGIFDFSIERLKELERFMERYQD
ncbi:hypothetical protein [Psychrobacillus sp. BM2]|uniref:hypothetical protein n=1 Tax=Psychrobacillus sp. BM2 TaxID=3400421 RepID=UPI003B02CA2C